MTVNSVQRLAKDVGTRVVPDPSAYEAGVSDGWTEAEHRAALVDTESVAGYWEGRPGWVAFDSWPYNEVCVILRGRVAIEDDEGQVLEFGAGEAFVVPAGFRGKWHTLEQTEKVFVGIMAEGSAS